jgi:hypothetical protein
MSIGNLKDYGNKGNNFPWQLKMLQGLQAMIDGNCCSDTLEVLDKIVNTIQPKDRSSFIRNYSGSGSIPAGVYSFSIANVGAAAGTVNGESLPAGVTINYDAGSLNNTFTNELIFDATGTTFLVTAVTN